MDKDIDKDMDKDMDWFTFYSLLEKHAAIYKEYTTQYISGLFVKDLAVFGIRYRVTFQSFLYPVCVIVMSSKLMDVLGKTKVPCEWVSDHTGYILVYPSVS